MIPENVRFAWLSPECWRSFRTAISLHSHTSHSREPLDFFPLRYRGEDAWWNPPLTPRQAWELECGQIGSLGLYPLVSITDHDDIEAPLRLRVLQDSRHTPISVEWSAPFEDAAFHIGVHGLPARRARECMAALAAYTFQPRADVLGDLLVWLSEQDETLVVFNHPCWDEGRLGLDRHMELVRRFLRRFHGFIHALELNGLRPWRENLKVAALAERAGLPLISGGDRHGCEPNANLNLTQARTFGEFVEEIRLDARSHILFMPQYRQSHTQRIARIVMDVATYGTVSARTGFRLRQNPVLCLQQSGKGSENLRTFHGLFALLGAGADSASPAPGTTGQR